MTDAIDTLARVLQDAPARLVNLSEQDAARRAPGGGWSPKEIIGHLIDSASNNHQRWVRALAAERTEFPKYEQAQWVASQNYSAARWPDLVNLWLLFNRHLLHIARAIPDDKRRHMVAVGGAAPMALEDLVKDYVRHLRHHLGSIDPIL